MGREVEDFIDPLLKNDKFFSTCAIMMQVVTEEKCNKCWTSSKFESILPPQKDKYFKGEKSGFIISEIKEVSLVISLY